MFLFTATPFAENESVLSENWAKGGGGELAHTRYCDTTAALSLFHPLLIFIACHALPMKRTAKTRMWRRDESSTKQKQPKEKKTRSLLVRPSFHVVRTMRVHLFHETVNHVLRAVTSGIVSDFIEQTSHKCV